MNSIEYIKNKIDILVEKYKHIRCRYEFDEFSQSHYIEVMPREYCQLDDFFLKDEMEIVVNFITQFPYESLVFITEGDLYIIEKPLYTKVGKDFGKQIIEFSFNELLDSNFKYYQSMADTDNDNLEYTFNNLFDGVSFKIKLEEVSQSSNEKPLFEAGEYNYAMAA